MKVYSNLALETSNIDKERFANRIELSVSFLAASLIGEFEHYCAVDDVSTYCVSNVTVLITDITVDILNRVMSRTRDFNTTLFTDDDIKEIRALLYYSLVQELSNFTFTATTIYGDGPSKTSGSNIVLQGGTLIKHFTPAIIEYVSEVSKLLLEYKK